MNLLTCLIKLGCFHAHSNTLSIKETFMLPTACLKENSRKTEAQGFFIVLPSSSLLHAVLSS